MVARTVYIGLAFLVPLVALTRFGTLGTEVVNWDESTFILVADRALHGEILYRDIFDNKPPMIFMLLAGVIAGFGKSLVAVRLFGDLCILISSLLVVLIARRFTTLPNAILGGCLTAACHGLYASQHTSSELPATAMVVAALWVLTVWRDRVRGLAVAGLLVSLATLTRTNLGVLAVGIGAYLTLAGLFGRAGLRPWAILPYTVAGLIPPAALAVWYWRIGALDEFWLGAVEVPLNYSVNRIGPLGNLTGNFHLWGQEIADHPVWIGGVTVLLLAGLAAFLLGRGPGALQSRDADQRAAAVLMLVVGLSVALSVLNSGYAYPYYWAQLYPFVGLLGAVLLAGVAWNRLAHLLASGVSLIVIAAALANTAPQAAANIIAPGRIAAAHEFRQIAARMAPTLAPDDRVWALRNHIILWYLDLPPVARIMAHPDNITRDAVIDPLVAAGYVPADQLQQIYDSHPAYIVTDGNRETPGFLPDMAYFETYVQTFYGVFFEDDKITVYRRLEHQGQAG